MTSKRCGQWKFKIDELSWGHYQVTATHERGPSVSSDGGDPDILLREVIEKAIDIEKQIGPDASSLRMLEELLRSGSIE